MPKSTPSPAKQALILAYLQNSGTVHNIKELEKALPSVASINGMQVKDFLQALSDDNKIKVEKIGSGNWYWSFLNEEKKRRENMLEELQIEDTRLQSSNAELQSQIEQLIENNDEDEKTSIQDRAALTATQTSLQQEVESLQTELAAHRQNDPRELDSRKQAATAHRDAATLWTDNICILEQYMLDITGRDREALEQVRHMCYGDEYREGEGLSDVDPI